LKIYPNQSADSSDFFWKLDHLFLLDGSDDIYFDGQFLFRTLVKGTNHFSLYNIPGAQQGII
jgi:hypothetical protein